MEGAAGFQTREKFSDGALDASRADSSSLRGSRSSSDTRR
jgi:hypothetical protein